LPLEEFIGARDTLAKRLKDAGDADAAAGVKKLRKPSVVAWAVNAAAREHPKDVEGLLEAGQDLRRAQRKTLSVAGTAELRAATELRRALIQRLADAAVAAIGDRGATHRDAIEGTLTAASVDDELGRRLSSATLDREARPAAGFGALEGFEVLTGGAASEDDDEEPAESPGARRDADRQKAREARVAERRAETAERAAERAAEHAAKLKEQAATATAAAREAESEARRLADEARTERKRADRAARAAAR
jgi:hypothetical protein